MKIKVLGMRTRIPAKPSQIATGMIVAFSAIGGWIVPGLGICNIVNGSMSVMGLVGWAPGLAGFFLCGRQGRIWASLMMMMILFCTAMSVIGIWYIDNHVDELRCFW